MHREQLEAWVSTAAAACAFNAPSAQAASVSASRQASAAAADERRSVLPSQSLRSGSRPIGSLFILNDLVTISCGPLSARPYIQYLVEIGRPGVFGGAFETPRDLRVIQTATAQQFFDGPTDALARTRELPRRGRLVLLQPLSGLRESQ